MDKIKAWVKENPKKATIIALIIVIAIAGLASA